MIIHEVPFCRAWRGALALMELGGLRTRKSRVFPGFANASMAQRRRSSITEQLQTTYRCHRPPKTKYQSGEGSGGGGFFSFSTSSA